MIPSHRGIPRAVAVDPTNRVFATAGMDCVIKVFDLASGKLELSLQGHTHGVRGLAFSAKYDYLFSCGEDKQVKAWDLELNQVVRQYNGHTAGVYCMAVHPTLDLLVTGGRDSTVRLWDMRSRQQVHCMTGHKDAVVSLLAQDVEPQVASGSEDSTVKLWDITAGRSIATLTHHKKGVRALARHPTEYSFAAATTGSVKKFAFPDGRLMHNFEYGQDDARTVIHSMQMSRSGEFIVAGTDDGYLKFWDWKSCKSFQNLKMKLQPGSLETECGVMAMSFDMTGERLITCLADKSIQMFKPVVA